MARWREYETGVPRRALVAGTVRAGFGAVIVGGLLVTLAFASEAGADAGWSRTPTSALPGSNIQVASSATTLCQWLQPADPVTTTTTATAPTTAPTSDPAVATGVNGISGIVGNAVGDPIVYDGTTVEVRLEGLGINVSLGAVAVTPGGAWSGTVGLPNPPGIAAGEYEMLAHCVVDHPDLDGVRSFDFDPLPFTVAEAPPPTTVTIPTEIDEPATAVNPVQVQAGRLNRVPSANAAVPVATLPNTGDGTLGVALAGIGALVLGAAALWWGTRQTAQHVS